MAVSEHVALLAFMPPAVRELVAASFEPMTFGFGQVIVAEGDPADALYVAPLRGPAPAGSPHLDLPQLIADGVVGSYRARLGWGPGRRPPRTTEELFALAGVTPHPDASAV